jgi:phosphatidylethanolamine/phosphatidyl-N-methylethanolamine N-methyltransferase
MAFLGHCRTGSSAPNGTPLTPPRAPSDLNRFLRSWASEPLRVGAVAPSGQALARLITSEISAETGPVLELGPGTGVFTQALLGRGVRARDLTLVEYGPEFAEMLRLRFPDVRVVCMDAAQVGRAGLFAGREVDAVVSGMPVLSMPAPKVMRILAGIVGCLREDGAIYQFTYGPRCPIPEAVLERFSLRATRIGRALRNVPPAAVYRISR